MGNVTMLEPGQTLGNRYEIKSVLGVGGMGMVYKANDKELGESVAIKTLKPEMMSADSSALERFKSEIKLARRISHRNVVRTYDLGGDGGRHARVHGAGAAPRRRARRASRLVRRRCRVVRVSRRRRAAHRGHADHADRESARGRAPSPVVGATGHSAGAVRSGDVV